MGWEVGETHGPFEMIAPLDETNAAVVKLAATTLKLYRSQMVNTTKADRGTMLACRPIAPLLAAMALPATVAMAVNALYNLVDTVFIGQGVGALAIAGLGVAFPVQIIVLSIALMMGIGTASVVSRSLGAGRPDRAAQAVGGSFTVLLLLALALTALGLLFLDEVLVLFGATPDILPYAREYLGTVLPGAAFIGTGIAANHSVRSEGRAAMSMAIVITGALANIGLDALFIFVFDMGIRGAALATVAAQFISFCLAIIFYASGNSSLPIKLRYLIPNPPIVREVMTVGLAAFVRQFGQSLFVIITNNALRTYGQDLHIAAFGVINRVLIFTLMPLIGIAHGLQPIVGYNYGAKNYRRVRTAVVVAFGISMVVALVFFTVIMAAPGVVFGIFTNSSELVEIGQEALRIVMLVLPAIGLQLAGVVFFQAVGKAVPALFLSMSRQIIFLIPLVLLLPRSLGLVGIWAAFPIADGAAAALTLAFLAREMRRLGIAAGAARATAVLGVESEAAQGEQAEVRPGDQADDLQNTSSIEGCPDV